MSLVFLFHYLMLSMFRMLIHPSSGACDLFVELFNGLYCSGLMSVGVTLWFGWGGVVSGCLPYRACITNFDVLLTVHLSIFISLINQLDAQNFCFTRRPPIGATIPEAVLCNFDLLVMSTYARNM